MVKQCLDLTRAVLRQPATPAAVRVAVFEGYAVLAQRLRGLELHDRSDSLASMVDDLSDQDEHQESTRLAAADALLALVELTKPRGERGGGPAEGALWLQSLARALDRASARERAYSVRKTIMQAKGALEGFLLKHEQH